jgi:ribosome assembly protein 4
MATRLPPPKRIKLDNGVPVLVSESVPTVPAPNVVVQFVSEDDGKPLAPAVNIPADFGRDGLEIMINKLSSKVSFLPNYPL